MNLDVSTQTWVNTIKKTHTVACFQDILRLPNKLKNEGCPVEIQRENIIVIRGINRNESSCSCSN